MVSPQHKIVEALGLPLHCLVWGGPPGEPLVLVHGFLDLAYSWTPFVRAVLREDPHRWIAAPDCRGHGDSGWVGGGGYYHFPDYVFDLDCVVQALGVKRIKLVGHSMGGTISLLYAGAFPERVSQLVLIEGVGPVGMEFSDAPKRMATWMTELHGRGRRHFRQYDSIEAGARQLRQTNPRLTEEAALDLARVAMKPGRGEKWIWKFDPLHRTTAPQPFYTGQALEFLRRIECPVIVVDGKQSHQQRRMDKQERYDAIAKHEHVTIDHAGHMVHQDNPEALAKIVVAFFHKVDCIGKIER